MGEKSGFPEQISKADFYRLGMTVHDFPPRKSRKRYLDFQEESPCIEPARSCPYEDREYVPITCPHCRLVFVKIPTTQLASSKASKCLSHLRVCHKFMGYVPPLLSKRRTQSRDLYLDRPLESVPRTSTDSFHSEGFVKAAGSAWPSCLQPRSTPLCWVMRGYV